MNPVLQWLQGKKTYIIALITVAYLVVQGSTGAMPWPDAIKLILAALGLGIGVNSTLQRIDRKMSGIKILLVGVLLLGLVGCQNQAALVHPAIIAADATTVTAKTLYQNKSISQGVAHKIGVDLDGANTVFVSLCTNLSAGTLATTTDISAVTTLLNTLEADISGTSAQGAEVKRKLVEMKMKIVAKASVSSGEITQIISILMEAMQIATAVIPEVYQEIELIVNGTPVTAADCQVALAQFQADLAAYHAAVDAAPASAPAGGLGAR